MQYNHRPNNKMSKKSFKKGIVKGLKSSSLILLCYSAFSGAQAQNAPTEKTVSIMKAPAQTTSKQVQKENVLKSIQLPAIKSITIDYRGDRTAENFPIYIESLKQFARQNGISEQTLTRAFDQVYFLERVVKADKNQPEKTITFDQYMKYVVSNTRIQTARQKYKEYRVQLQKASELTQVPANYIVALWGIESGFGVNQGKEDIISAVSTLAFDGRREAFFARELLASLHILQEGHIEKNQFKGSWAGAMGQNQFMPSSYLAFGLDGDNDGIIDIWNNPADIFASTGNYLKTVGWNKSERWGNKVIVPKNLNPALVGLDKAQAKPVSEWLKLGIKWQNKEISHLKQSTKAWLVFADKDDPNTAYLVSNNFQAIMHWNKSLYFAISVGTLADAIVAPTEPTQKPAQAKPVTNSAQKQIPAQSASKTIQTKAIQTKINQPEAGL